MKKVCAEFKDGAVYHFPSDRLSLNVEKHVVEVYRNNELLCEFDASQLVKIYIFENTGEIFDCLEEVSLGLHRENQKAVGPVKKPLRSRG